MFRRRSVTGYPLQFVPIVQWRERLSPKEKMEVRILFGTLFMPNIYSSPEEFDLGVFATLNQPDQSYEFNMFVVWITGRYITDRIVAVPVLLHSRA